MELDESKPNRPSSGSHDGPTKQNGERNLATRRHTVGPSETAHDQVMGKHLKLEHGARGSPSFYPAPGFTGLGYGPLNLPSHMGFNPLTTMNPVMDTRQRFLPPFELNVRTPTAGPSALNAQFPTVPGFPDSTGTHGAGTCLQSRL